MRAACLDIVLRGVRGMSAACPRHVRSMSAAQTVSLFRLLAPYRFVTLRLPNRIETTSLYPTRQSSRPTPVSFGFERLVSIDTPSSVPPSLASHSSVTD